MTCLFLTLGCGSQTQVLTERRDSSLYLPADTEQERAFYVQQGTTKIRSEGASKVNAKDIAKARELAQSFALRKAVESQLEALVALSIEQAKKVKEKFTANPNRYVAKFQLVRESANFNVALTVLDVEVMNGRLVHELIKDGFLANLKQKPILTIAISETLNDAPVTLSLLAPELTKRFLGYGFKVREQTLSNRDVQSILQDASQERGIEVVKRKFKGDVVIIGQAKGEILPPGEFGKFTSCRINAVIKAIMPDTSEVLASDTFALAFLGVTETDARREASARLAPKVADSIAKSVIPKWVSALDQGDVTPYVDKTASKPPQITIHAPDDKSVTSYESILLRGTVDDDKGVSKVKIRYNGAQLAITKDLHIVPSQGLRDLKIRPQTNENVTQINRSIPLAPGKNVIDVIAYDADNNKAEKQITVFRNSSEANGLIEIHSPTDGEITAQRFVHMRGEIKEAPSVLQIEVNGEPLPVKKDLHLIAIAPKEGKSFPLNYHIPLTQAKNIIGIIASLPDGKVEKYLTVFADNASIQRMASGRGVGEPQIVIYSPPDNTRTSAQAIQLQGEIITTETIAKITIEKDGKKSAEIENPEKVEYDSASWSYMVYEIDREVKLQVGENKLQLTAHYGQNKKAQKKLAITLQDAAPKMQPQIIIQSPQDGATVTTNLVFLKGHVANATVSKIILLVNGMELPTQRDINLVRVEATKAGKIIHRLDRQIPLSAGKNVIKVVASTDEKTSAKPSSFGKLTAQRTITFSVVDEPFPKNINKYAVIIGIGKYKDTSITTLEYAPNDAEEMYELLIAPAHGNFPKDNVKKLINEQATLKNIKSAIGTWLPQNVKPDDMVILFYSGHGGVECDESGEESDGKDKYIIPYDAQANDLFATALLNSHISTMLDRVPSNRMVFFIDSCYSGGVTDTISNIKTISKLPLKAGTNVYEQLSGRGRIVISASQANEVSFEMPKYEHGIFTYYLLKGLRGEADSNGDSIVTLFEIFPYLSVKVPNGVPAEFVGQNSMFTQNPMFMGTLVGDIVLAQVGN